MNQTRILQMDYDEHGVLELQDLSSSEIRKTIFEDKREQDLFLMLSPTQKIHHQTRN